VEKAVSIAYQRIYAPLRHQTFYSLEELNTAIRKQLAACTRKHVYQYLFPEELWAEILKFISLLDGRRFVVPLSGRLAPDVLI